MDPKYVIPLDANRVSCGIPRANPLYALTAQSATRLQEPVVKQKIQILSSTLYNSGVHKAGINLDSWPEVILRVPLPQKDNVRQALELTWESLLQGGIGTSLPKRLPEQPESFVEITIRFQ